MKYRIFIESDVLDESELRSVERRLYLINSDFERFQEILDFAWHDLEKTWASVKRADEIYANSSLMPLIGGSYTGAPVIFDGMCERAIKQNVTGKDVYILRPQKDIYWEMIDIKQMKKAFKNNRLFMYNEDRNIIQVDIKNVKI